MTDKADASMGHFPSRVMAILEDEVVQQLMHWLPDGKAFKIIKPSQFTKVTLQKHFKGIQLLSFIKSLSQWGFKVEGEKVAGRYLSYTLSSPLFLRDKPELCKTMARMTKKDWKAGRSKRKPAMPPPAEHPQPVAHHEIPAFQAGPPQIPVPLIVPVVQVQPIMQPMWPVQVIDLPVQPYPLIRPQSHTLPTMSRFPIPQLMQKRALKPQSIYRSIHGQMPLKDFPQGNPTKKVRPQSSEDTVTVLKQNVKVTLSRNELNAAIGISMLEDVL